MSRQPSRDFHEYVKNPELFRAEFQPREPAPAKELLTLVNDLYLRNPDYDEKQQLRQAGRAVIPPLLAVISDPKFLGHCYGKSVLDGAPLEVALDLLEPFAEPQVEVLGPALRHENERVRSRALYHLGRCGRDDAVPELLSGLATPSLLCRTYALLGLGFLKASDRGSAAFRRVLFAAIVPLLHEKEYDVAEQVPQTLLALDQQQAHAILFSADIIRSDNRNAHLALRACRESDVTARPDRLRDYLASIKGQANDYPFKYAYADGLILLARAEGSAANDLIADARAWGGEQIQEAVAVATAVAAGVLDAYAFVMDRLAQVGNDYDGLTEPQRFYLTSTWLDSEVRNGGFSQYYFNSSSDLAAYASKAARSVGADEVAQIIENSIQLFGARGPSADREERMAQLSTIDLEELGKLDTEYNNCHDDLRQLLPMYVARHATDFKPLV